MERVVAPEILDSLPGDDPRALRSRRDLRLINAFMRGEWWILQQLRLLGDEAESPLRVVELGAGDGAFLNVLAESGLDLELVGVDLQSAPESLHGSVKWIQGDVMEGEWMREGSVVVANLFLHHLSDEMLRVLGGNLSGARAVFFAEPHRAGLPCVMGRCLFPFVNEVTRHDMIVSIKAGFQRGELPALLGLDLPWEESLGVFGGLRVKGELA